MTGGCHIGNTNSDSQGLWTPITRMSAEAHVQGEGRLCKWELRDKLSHEEEKENSLLERRKAQHMRTPSPPQLSKRNREALVGDQKVGHGKQRCLPLFLSLLLLPSALRVSGRSCVHSSRVSAPEVVVPPPLTESLPTTSVLFS